MDDFDPDSLAPLLTLTAFAQALALVVLLAWRGRVGARTGRILVAARPRRGGRLAALGGVVLVAALVLAGGIDLPAGPALVVLGLAAALLAVLPGPADSACGEDGVRLGWSACRYEDLEEWRLTGDHLRWRVGRTWLACDVPAALQGELRARLERLCPAAESRFSR